MSLSLTLPAIFVIQGIIEPVEISRRISKENDVVADDISESVCIAQLVEQPHKGVSLVRFLLHTAF